MKPFASRKEMSTWILTGKSDTSILSRIEATQEETLGLFAENFPEWPWNEDGLCFSCEVEASYSHEETIHGPHCGWAKAKAHLAAWNQEGE